MKSGDGGLVLGNGGIDGTGKPGITGEDGELGKPGITGTDGTGKPGARGVDGGLVLGNGGKDGI